MLGVAVKHTQPILTKGKGKVQPLGRGSVSVLVYDKNDWLAARARSPSTTCDAWSLAAR